MDLIDHFGILYDIISLFNDIQSRKFDQTGLFVLKFYTSPIMISPLCACNNAEFSFLPNYVSSFMGDFPFP